MKIPPKYHSDAQLRKEIIKYKREVLKDYISASKELSKACKSVMNEFISTQTPSKHKNKNKNKKSVAPPPPPPPPSVAPPPPPPPKKEKKVNNKPKVSSSGLPFMSQLLNVIKNKKNQANKHSISTNGKKK